MPPIGWTVSLDGKSYTVELDHGWLLGTRTIRLDGAVLQHTTTVRDALLDRGSTHPFQIDNHACELWIESNWAGPFRYVLMVDGRALMPSTPIPSQALMMTNTAILGIVLGLLATGLLHAVRAYLGW